MTTPTKTKKKYTPEDIIEAVFYLSGVQKFSGNEGALHEFFASVQPRYSILNGFVFSNKGPVPTSPLLGEVMNNLLFCRTISLTDNLDNYMVTDSCREEVKSALSLFSAEEVKELREIGNEFKKNQSRLKRR